jgi:hypothetical protein
MRMLNYALKIVGPKVLEVIILLHVLCLKEPPRAILSLDASATYPQTRLLFGYYGFSASPRATRARRPRCFGYEALHTCKRAFRPPTPNPS